MRLRSLALLFPALSFAAGYPPGTYSMTGFVEPDWLAPSGFDLSLWFTWDGGNIPETIIFQPSDPPIVIPGSLQGGWYQEPREGGCCAGDLVFFDDMYNPEGFALGIENGLLNGFYIFISGAGDPLLIDVDFENGTVFSSIVYRGGYGTLNRAPGYISSDVPEPATWTLLLLGATVMVWRKRAKILA